jgi:AraC-like DNA-binding protein
MSRMAALFQPFPMLGGRRAQVWRHQPAYRRPRHFHAEPELNVVLGGSAIMGVGDRTVVAAAGHVLLFQPGQDHVLLEASDDFELFVVGLRPELAEFALGAHGPAIRCAELDERELSLLDAELSGLCDVRDGAINEERLVGVFSRATERSPKGHVHSRRALQLLKRRRDASEGQLARELGVDPSGISRHFHGDLAVTLVEYRSRLRLMRFVDLVDAGASFGRAALDADFGSYAQCHRVFRRLLGCSPSQYFHGARAIVDGATA